VDVTTCFMIGISFPPVSLTHS